MEKSVVGKRNYQIWSEILALVNPLEFLKTLGSRDPPH